MTIESPNTLNTTRLQTGQAAGSIDPVDAQVVVDSLAGLFATATSSNPYDLTLADKGTLIEQNNGSANNVRVPTNASVAFDIGTVISIYQMNLGQVTVVAITPGTTTIRNSASSFKTRAQFSVITLRKRGTDEWVLTGDVA